MRPHVMFVSVPSWASWAGTARRRCCRKNPPAPSCCASARATKTEPSPSAGWSTPTVVRLCASGARKLWFTTTEMRCFNTKHSNNCLPVFVCWCSAEPHVHSVQPYTKLELVNMCVPDIIYHYSLRAQKNMTRNPLLYLYPDIPKDAAFGRYYKKTGSVSCLILTYNVKRTGT